MLSSSYDLLYEMKLLQFSFLASTQREFSFSWPVSVDVDADRLALEPLNGDTLTRPKCPLTAQPLYYPYIANCSH